MINGQPHGIGGPMSEEAKGAAADSGDRRLKSEEGGEGEAGFDYLGYAQQRALLFWGDMLTLGIMTPEEVGKEVVGKAKVIAW